MRRLISPEWKTKCLDDISALSDPAHPVFEQILNFNAAAQWLVIILTKKDIPFKVLNLGAGVKKITTDVTVCPKCKGTGHV